MSEMRDCTVAIAMFRYPHAQRYCRLTQLEGQPDELLTCEELGAQRGFVMAPFAPSAARPVVVIRPDRVEWSEVPQGALSLGGCDVQTLDGATERQRYGTDFRNFHDRLVDGAFGKIVLARCSQMTTAREADVDELFFCACRRYPRMFVALVQAPRCGTWLMATPEILLQGSGREWHTMALAGTMKLCGDMLDFDTPGAHTSADDIVWSEKNRFEQRYVADYIAESVGRLSADVASSAPYTTRAGDLVHLRTDFRFTLADGRGIGRVINSLHPTPAVCGMPKQQTFDFIMAHEQMPRDYYSGFAGPMGIDGQTSLFVALRCMRIAGRSLSFYAGGGLLADSREEDEWNETEAKMETMKKLFN